MHLYCPYKLKAHDTEYESPYNANTSEYQQHKQRFFIRRFLNRSLNEFVFDVTFRVN